jgi:hypothetical protein
MIVLFLRAEKIIFFVAQMHANMAEEEMAVYGENGTLVLAKHLTFTRPFLNQTSAQNYLNSLYYVYIY